MIVSRVGKVKEIMERAITALIEGTAEMTVDEFAEALISEGVKFVLEGRYTNSSGQTGYRAIYRNADCYLWFSVSSIDVPLAPDEVALAIRSSSRWIQRERPYFNGKGQQGFEATVHCEGHAYMLAASPDPPPWR